MAPYGDPTPAFDVTIFLMLFETIYHVHSTGWYASNKDDIEAVGPFGNGFTLYSGFGPYVCGGE